MFINDLSLRTSAYRERLETALGRVLDNGFLVLGPHVSQFEEAFANYLGASFCVGVGNGTDAIELSLKALGVRSGDAVATVANAGMYTSSALMAIGAQPIYVDVDVCSKTVSLAEVERAIDAGVRAVVVTHLYGLAAPDVEQIAALCRAKGVWLVEDCAQAHGAIVGNQRVGTFGDAASFSFYPTKNLGALGDGGAVVTNDPEVATRVRRLRQYGWASKYNVESTGGRNSRLDELQAAVLSVFLPDLDGANKRRNEIATEYSNSIKHNSVVVPPIYGAEYVAHLYVVAVESRESLREYLKGVGISTDVHYPIPDYKQRVFQDRFSDLHLKNTEKLSTQVLTLPCFPELTDKDIDFVVRSVNSWPGV